MKPPREAGDAAVDGEEVFRAAETDRVKPEDIVERVVQARRDEETVERGVKACANCAEISDAFSERDQAGENERPDEKEREGGGDGKKARQYGDAAFAAEEGEPVRETGVLETVITCKG